MADVHTKEVRSYNMSQIRSRNTKPELLVRKYLFAKGFRYRLHSKNLPGKPDIVLPKYKTVIFVHGCFWHGCKSCNKKAPMHNSQYWILKIQRNIHRDEVNRQQLQTLGYKVIEIWEHDFKKLPSETLLRIKSFIES